MNRLVYKISSGQAISVIQLQIVSFLIIMIFPAIIYSSSKDTLNQSDDSKFWYNIGVGGARVHDGLGNDEGGISGGMTMSYAKSKNIYTVRWVSTAEFQLNVWGSEDPPEGVWDIGVLYGRKAKSSSALASIAGGVALTGISEYSKTSYIIGIPIETQLFWTPSSYVGLGIYSFANLNDKKSFAGFLFCLQLGQLR